MFYFVLITFEIALFIELCLFIIQKANSYMMTLGIVYSLEYFGGASLVFQRQLPEPIGTPLCGFTAKNVIN